ncbi:MAG: TIM barrel protein [Planctomycetes bacterium]|nr:TIM barrel protein [Planctomycetota bacterium]
MSSGKVSFTIFTKPWTIPLGQLGKMVKGMGFDGVELPVRPNYQVEPANIAKGLPEAARILANEGIKIGSIGGPTDEATIAACGEAGIPIIRVCVDIDMKIGYMASEQRIRKQYDALLPILDKHKVAIGVQNHCDYNVGSAIGIMHLIEKYDPKHICAVLDMAHCGLDGEPVDMALDIVWPQLNGLINFKSAFRYRLNGPEETEASFNIQWTTCHHSNYSWSKMVGLLKQKGYTGNICLPAEYSDMRTGRMVMDDSILPMVREDLAYIKALFASQTPGQE